MKVAIDITPLKNEHQFRGIGVYTKSLINTLQSIKAPDFSVHLIEKGKIPDDCDLVHYPFFDFFFLTLPLKKPKPTVVTIHDCTPLVFPENYPPGVKGEIKFLIQKLSLKGVRRVIADSENSKRDIIKFLGVPKSKIDVIYLAAGNQVRRVANREFLTKLSNKFNLPKKFVLYVGDVNFNKNLPGLVKACRKVEIPLVLVGKQATQTDFDAKNIENQSLIELIKLIKGKKDVLRSGFVKQKELAGLYSLASVYCQPSFYEGFGMQILEAMSIGCPVVTSNVSSLPEVAEKAAVLVNPYKVEEIAKAIEKVTRDQNLAEELRKAGFTQVKKFSWEKTARQTIASYKRALA